MKETVEHILPENALDSEWPLFPPAVHERSVEKLANYVSSRRSLNTKESANASFGLKKEVFEASQ